MTKRFTFTAESAGRRRPSLCPAVVFLVALIALALPVPSPARAAASDAIVLAAGDIANCKSDGDEATAALLDTLPGTVLALGDNAYPDGSAADYANCYAPTWGRHLARSKPVPGNHDYVPPRAAPYFDYFGAAAGDRQRGYYSFDLGGWHVVALNSSCKVVGGCEAESPMEQWLRADLAAASATAAPCILAFWHHPRFFSPAAEPGETKFDKTDSKMTSIWRDLQAAGADVVLSGHRHVYERFSRQDGDGILDPSGIRQFVVGTGGGDHEHFVGDPAPHSEIRQEDMFGVLQLTLHLESYDWRFVPVAGDSFTDSGSESCHASAPATTTPAPPGPAAP